MNKELLNSNTNNCVISTVTIAMLQRQLVLGKPVTGGIRKWKIMCMGNGIQIEI